MKQKLIEAIREVSIAGKTYEQYVTALADKLITLFPAWIPVEERLPDPKEYDWVLVNVLLTPEDYYGVPHIAELRNDKWWSDDDFPLSEVGCKVTHWMPLPQYWLGTLA